MLCGSLLHVSQLLEQIGTQVGHVDGIAFHTKERIRRKHVETFSGIHKNVSAGCIGSLTFRLGGTRRLSIDISDVWESRCTGHLAKHAHTCVDGDAFVGAALVVGHAARVDYEIARMELVAFRFKRIIANSELDPTGAAQNVLVFLNVQVGM